MKEILKKKEPNEPKQLIPKIPKLPEIIQCEKKTPTFCMFKVLELEVS